MLLSPACIPRILSGIGAILTASPTHLLSAPCSLVLLAVIIWGYFPMIPFLISACVFLISGVHPKTQTNMHLVDLGLGVQYQN
jgi:hypothetical protein